MINAEDKKKKSLKSSILRNLQVLLIILTISEILLRLRTPVLRNYVIFCTIC